MLKNISNLEGAQQLNKEQQQSINGGGLSCNKSCSGNNNGSLCFKDGHCGCPGYCSGSECILY